MQRLPWKQLPGHRFGPSPCHRLNCGPRTFPGPPRPGPAGAPAGKELVNDSALSAHDQGALRNLPLQREHTASAAGKSSLQAWRPFRDQRLRVRPAQAAVGSHRSASNAREAEARQGAQSKKLKRFFGLALIAFCFLLFLTAIAGWIGECKIFQNEKVRVVLCLSSRK